MTAGDIAEARPLRRVRWESLTGGGVILQDESYRRLWLARLASHTALNAVLYTLLVLAVGEGGGASIKSALFISAYLIPTATLGTFSGVIVDRLPKHLVLCAINIARVGLMLILIMSSAGLWTVYGVALLIAVTSQFSAPAEAAALPQVVPQDQLTTANSTNNFGGLLSQIAGFTLLAPVFLNTVGPRPLFFASMVLFTIGAVLFLSIKRLGERQVDIDHVVDAVRDVRREFASAWERLGDDTLAYMSVIISVLASTASLVAVTLMPKFTQDVLDIPVRNAIYIFLPAALGIVTGLRVVHWMERRASMAWLVGAGFALLVLSFLGLAMTRPFGTTIASMNLFGLFSPGPLDETAARIFVAIAFSTLAAFSFSLVGVASRSAVNQRIPIEIQGRVFAAQVVLTNLASIPPILLAGLLSELSGVAPVMVLTVVILVSAAGWTLAQALSKERLRAEAR